LNLSVKRTVPVAPAKNKIHLVHVEKACAEIPTVLEELEFGAGLAEHLVMTSASPNLD
jgi:hypothetical protein